MMGGPEACIAYALVRILLRRNLFDTGSWLHRIIAGRDPPICILVTKYRDSMDCHGYTCAVRIPLGAYSPVGRIKSGFPTR